MAQQTVHNRNDEKQRALGLALGQIEKQYGKGAIMRLGESQITDISVIPTGSLALDAALGVGGMPRGRIVEIYGPEASGKTTLALHVIASAQRGGGEAAFVDAEHALDPAYARKLGVNLENLLISQPDSGEQALEITDVLVRSGALDVVVLTSDNEGMPISLIEAALAGRPAVTTDVGSAPEVVIDGETGFVTSTHVDDLAKAVERLLADPELRARMGDAATGRAVRQFGAARLVTFVFL